LVDFDAFFESEVVEPILSYTGFSEDDHLLNKNIDEQIISESKLSSAGSSSSALSEASLEGKSVHLFCLVEVLPS
jgi:hypothetical protein